MVKFKCRNCNNVFEKFCDTCQHAENVQCPKCKSHWVEIYHEEKKELNPFPRGPYDDPIYPWPQVDPTPWPRDGYRS